MTVDPGDTSQILAGGSCTVEVQVTGNSGANNPSFSLTFQVRID